MGAFIVYSNSEYCAYRFYFFKAIFQVLDVLMYQITVIHIPSVSFDVQFLFDVVIEIVWKEYCAYLGYFTSKADAGLSVKSCDKRSYHFVRWLVKINFEQFYQFFMVDASEIVFEVKYQDSAFSAMFSIVFFEVAF